MLSLFDEAVFLLTILVAIYVADKHNHHGYVVLPSLMLLLRFYKTLSTSLAVSHPPVDNLYTYTLCSDQ